ncbi:MAG: CAP domain-containing protein [Sphingomonas sp.]
MSWLAVVMWMFAPVPGGNEPERAAPVSAAAALEAEVLEEVNRMRANPQAYADGLRGYRQGFDGLVVRDEESPDGIFTHEGVAAVDEAIAFLDRQAPLPPLGASALLALGAADLAADQETSGQTGHISGNGFGPGERVRRRGGDIYVGEVVSYGHAIARGVVRQLVVDDGVARRGHRGLLFAKGYRYAGVACGAHERYGVMCVVDMAATPTGRPVVPQLAATPAPRPAGF